MTDTAPAADPAQPGGPTVADTVASALHREAEAYRNGENRPLRSFVGVMATYLGVVGIAGFVTHRRGKTLRLKAPDVVLMAVATHRLSRLLAKDPVTSPLRAPFTRFEGTSGPAELKEEVRGTGIRKAVGELVTCPFCLAQWVATGFVFAFMFAPRVTRVAASILAAVAGADFLHLAYSRAEQAAQS